MSNKEIIAAIDRNTEAVKSAADDISGALCMVFVALLVMTIIGCPLAKAAPLVSDGDEIASVGSVQVITPHPSWAAPLEGTSWISIAQTGWPLTTFIPNGTIVTFFEVFNLDLMPSSAMVTFAADDSASLWVNGDLVVAEAEMAGNAYTVCSDTGVTCTAHTTVDVLPWLIAGKNKLRFDVAQRGGWSYGLNYVVALTWLDDPVSVPEPVTWAAVLAVMVAMLLLNSHLDMRKLARLNDRLDDIEMEALQYKHALEDIVCTNTDEQGLKEIARKALEE